MYQSQPLSARNGLAYFGIKQAKLPVNRSFYIQVCQTLFSHFQTQSRILQTLIHADALVGSKDRILNHLLISQFLLFLR